MTNYLKNYTINDPLIEAQINEDLNLIIVIPSYKEPELELTLKSIISSASFKLNSPVEVITVLNFSETENDEVKKETKEQYSRLKNKFSKTGNANIKFHFILAEDLPAKHAGVGLARKIGMDEACFRFEKINNTNGVIVCLDADCSVSENYLSEIEKFYLDNTEANAANIYFEHNLDKNKKEIIKYEIFLRYYIEALRYTGYPFSYHTIGSCISVKHKIYQKQGGMNKRKAAEDFYFLHKIIPLGNFHEINKVTVFPSSRISDRVPFGTGKAVFDALNNKNDLKTLYHPDIFKVIKSFFSETENIYNDNEIEFNETLKQYLEQIQFDKAVIEIKNNTKDKVSFINRYYKFWDGLKVLKMVHFLRDHYLANIEINEACRQLFQLQGNEMQWESPEELLLALRNKQHHPERRQMSP